MTVALLGLAAAAYGGASASATTTGSAATRHTLSTVAVKTRKISGLGTVLVNAKGKTLYTFSKDARTKVTCTGACAGVWPPLKWKLSSKPTAASPAKTSLLGTDKTSSGKVVTYNKWPLYTYSGDTAAGQAHGQTLNLNGGHWYVISPSGKIIKASMSSGGGGTTTSGGGWG